MIEKIEPADLLKRGAEEFGIVISDEQVDQFMQYMELLKQWNRKMNLTAIEDDREIVIKHFVDSLTILQYIKEEKADVIDVGSGAGFPGIPLKILKGGLDITLLDSLQKRVSFLREVITSLELDGIKAVHGRAEDFGKDGLFREKFQYSVARAVAGMPVLLEYCLPFVKVGGFFIAMKGKNTEEIEESKKALDILGGEIEAIKEFQLPYFNSKRNIILVKKLRHTPTKYPRKSGKPSKQPLK